MELQQVRTFRMVAAMGSFTRAASALAFAQSSVTAQIQALEGSLGVQLFQRLPRKVVLTDPGRRFLKVADAMVQLADQARQVVQAPEEPQGPLTLSAPVTLCTHWLPRVFRDFRRACPKVRLVFRPTPFTELRRLVGEGTLDLAFVLEEPIKEGVLVVEPLFPVAMRVVAPRDHPLASRKAIRAADLQGESILLTELGCSYRNLFEHALLAAGVHPGETLEFESVEAIKQCVMAGLGISVLPELAVRREVAQGRLKALAWPEAPMTIHAQAVFRSEARSRPAVQAFLELARKHAEKRA
ncbi:MAG TPA: LysR family transcriptional regulator [Holophaga sp.]|nr:LysR family transcriptional regulator [Holophaga sp.]